MGPDQNTENTAELSFTALMTSNVTQPITISLMSGDYTLAFIAWRKKRRNHRVIFGRPVKRIRLDWQRSIAAFTPGDIFAYERWEANQYGTQHWSISVLQAGAKGERFSKLPGLKPGAHVLARREGVDACKAFFNILDKLQANCVLQTVRPTDWHIIGHRLAAGEKPEYVLKDMGFSQ